MSLPLPYIAPCRYDDTDRIEVEVVEDDSDIRLGLIGGSVYLSPKKARRLAKAIKKAAKHAKKAEAAR